MECSCFSLAGSTGIIGIYLDIPVFIEDFCITPCYVNISIRLRQVSVLSHGHGAERGEIVVCKTAG